MLRLLGLVEGWDPAGSTPDSPRQRLVLAALAVDAGRPVPVDLLVDRVWGASPPPRARRTLQAYVARTRRALAGSAVGEDSAHIEGRGGTYALAIDPQRVDLHRFRRLVGQAVDPACRSARRVDLLRDAVRLWRGPALAGLDSPWAGRMRESWQQERIAATVAWADAELAAGEPERALRSVADLAADHPLVESLAGALMRIHAQAGRMAEALRCYQDVRERLVDELGVDPGPQLQEIHRAVLRGELSARPVSGPNGSSSVAADDSAPAQLPLDLAAFAGRHDEIAVLDALLDAEGDPATTVVVLSGTAGVGKTALAVHWAHRVAKRFPDGQLFINLRGFDPGGAAVTSAQAIREFLEAFGVAARRIPDSPAAQAALYRSVLAGRRVLVVLDNARDVEHVRPLMPGTSGCVVLVTSREQLLPLAVAQGARLLTVDLLPPAGARALLVRRLGARRVQQEPAAVEEIVTRCARLPLALAITAAHAATRPAVTLAALAAELRGAAGALDPFADGDPTIDIRAVFSSSYRTLSKPAARLFRLLGAHAGPSIAAPGAASLTGLPLSRVRAPLAELCRAHLLTEQSPGRYAFHDLLRAYAAEQASDRTDQRQALHRLLDHYLHTGHVAADALHPPFSTIRLAPAQTGVTTDEVADAHAAQTWFDAELPILLVAAGQAARHGFARHAWQLAWVATRPLDRIGRWQDLAAVHDIAVAAARAADDRDGLAHSQRGLGWAYFRLGRLDDAVRLLTLAGDLFAEVGDESGLAHVHLSLSQVLERDGRLKEALIHSERALDLFESAGHRAGQAYLRNVVGWKHALLGDHERALVLCRQAVGELQDAGDQQGEADAWDSLGYAHHHLGAHQQATACYQRALALFAITHDRYGRAATLANLADNYEAAADPDAARAAWVDALTLLTDLDHPDANRARERLHLLTRPVLAVGLEV
jgi:DNA-binding SARP family transcriptional activator/tetratricopeptide (TPR) repeat protein